DWTACSRRVRERGGRMTKLLFLHGIGDARLSRDWLSALRSGLEQVGYPRVEADHVIAPGYTRLLQQQPPPRCQMPPVTSPKLPPDQAERERWEYERRQASLEHLLGEADLENPWFGWPDVPEVLKALMLAILDEAKRYVGNDGLRACILRE